MEIPRQVAAVMDETGVWWAIAGGWAIDQWLGEQTRHHHDIEIVVRRDDLPAVHTALVGTRSLDCVDPPGSGWREWSGEPVQAPAFQLRARGQGLAFDLFAETVDDETWSFRRDRRITRPLTEVTTPGPDGIPVVAPEIQLLYMAKSSEPKHEHDFHAVLARLPHEARIWLARALVVTHPAHRWITELV
jgi:hypothetical protein